jgi:hypothetical protein
LKRDYYGGNSFDIGTFDPTIQGIIGKAPKAIMAGVYRPYIWDQVNFHGYFGIETLIL